MPVSLDYVTRETASNLWRNRLMTIAAVLTVAVSLSLVGTAMLLRQGVAHATTQWQHGVSVELFLKPSVSTAQKSVHPAATAPAALRPVLPLPLAGLRLQRGPSTCSRPDEAQALTVGTTPSSLRCVLNNPSQAQAIAKQFDGYPGVAECPIADPGHPNMESVTQHPAVGLPHPGRDPPVVGLGPHPEHDPVGHLRPTARSVGHEAGRGHQLVHPRALHVRRRGPGSARRRRGRRWWWSSCISS